MEPKVPTPSRVSPLSLKVVAALLAVAAFIAIAILATRRRSNPLEDDLRKPAPIAENEILLLQIHIKSPALPVRHHFFLLHPLYVSLCSWFFQASNNGFLTVTIDEKSYQIENKVWPRNCSNTDCSGFDALTVLQTVWDRPKWKYVYLIDSNSYYCSDVKELITIAELGYPIVATGYKGSGFLLSRDKVTSILKANKLLEAKGLRLDQYFSQFHSNQIFRYYRNINARLHQEILRKVSENSPQPEEYPACFEVACQGNANGAAPFAPNTDYYNLLECDGIVEQSFRERGCDVDVPRVIHVPLCGHFCKTQCHSYRNFLIYRGLYNA